MKQKINLLLLFCISLTAAAQTKYTSIFERPARQSAYIENVKVQSEENVEVLTELSLYDSLELYFRQSMRRSKLEHTQFYSMSDDGPNLFLYFNMGYHYNKNQKSAIVAWMLNDTTVYCDLYTLTDSLWRKSGKECLMHIYGFSPAYFSSVLADYNFDNHKDIFFNFYHSMGVVYSHGYLLVYDSKYKCLVVRPETIDIADMKIDRRNKTIISEHHSNPNAEYEKYKVVYRYKWIGDSLQLVKEKKISYGYYKKPPVEY